LLKAEWANPERRALAERFVRGDCRFAQIALFWGKAAILKKLPENIRKIKPF
jgi:hypothetical protein